MTKFLVSSYAILVEICLWLFFLGAAIGGYQIGGGGGGALIGLIVAFVFSVIFIAPSLMIDEMRARLAKIETRSRETTENVARLCKITGGEQGGVYSAPAGMVPERQRASGERSSSIEKSPGHIKWHKGVQLVKTVEGVQAGGQTFDDVLKAEAAINAGEVKPE
ncbi:MAG: hypothetical protein ACWA5A_01400 [Marinibacterium sp.]